jgi:hypothetical protein
MKDAEEIIKEFWKCSVLMDFSEFDWDEAFESAEEHLRRLMAQHGYLGVDEFIEYTQDWFGDLGESIPSWAIFVNNFVHFDAGDAVRAICTAIVEMYEKADLHPDLRELHLEVQEWDNLDEKHRIALFDKCIDAEHHSGSIWDLDIEDMRNDFEKEAIELRKEAMMI